MQALQHHSRPSYTPAQNTHRSTWNVHKTLQKSDHCFKISQLNCRSFLTRQAELEQLFFSDLNSLSDVVCFSETWLNEGSIISSHLGMPGYLTFRRDRSTNQGRAHGGLLVYARNSFCVTRRTDLESPDVEVLESLSKCVFRTSASV